MYSPKENGAQCHICPLNKEVVVPPQPAKGVTRLIVVGESPGRYESKLGRPFVGPSGNLLNQVAEGGPTRDTWHITNATLCRPEGEKDLERAALCCAPRLYKELSSLPSHVPILTLGKVACNSVLGTKRLMFARGFVWKSKTIDEKVVGASRRKATKNPSPENELKALNLEGRAQISNRIVVPSIHPAFVLRADFWKPVLKVDVDRALRLARGELDINRLLDSGPYRVVGSLEDLRKALGELAPSIACDIETDGIDPLTTKVLCCGVSDGEKTVVAHPWREEFAPEFQAFFENREEVVFHNGYNFDQIVLQRHGVNFEGVHLEDTILAFHAIASHFPKRLDFVVSMFVDSGPWKMRFGRRGAEEKGQAPNEMSGHDLCMYNAADCRLTILVWKKLKELLE